MQKVQKVKIKRECKKNRMTKREKRKEKQKMKKVGMIRKFVGNRYFLRLCRCFCLKKCFSASFVYLSTPDGFNIILRYPISSSEICDIFLLLHFTFLRTSCSSSPPIEKTSRWRPNMTSKWRPWLVDSRRP